MSRFSKGSGGGGGGASPYIVASVYGNDLAALQSAHTAAVAADKPIYITGTFTVTGSFTTSVSIISRGGIIQATAVIDNVLVVDGDDIVIQGLIIDGDDNATQGIVVVEGHTKVDILDNEVKNITQPGVSTVQAVGIRLEGGLSDILVQNNYVHHVSAPNSGIARGILGSKAAVLQDDSFDVTINDNRIENITPDTDADGIVVQDWYVDDNTGAFTGNALVTITNNKFDFCAKRAIKLQSPGCYVAGNIAKSPYLGENSASTTPHAFISCYADNCVILGNIVFGGAFIQAIEVGGVSLVVKNITIASNQVILTPDVADRTDGFRAYGVVSSLTLSDNVFSGVRYGIYLTCSGESTSVAGNTIRDATFPAIYSAGDGTNFMNDMSIANNVFEACEHYGVSIDGGLGNTVVGNTGFADFGLLNDNVAANATVIT